MNTADTSHRNRHIRSFLFALLNKEFLVFLFFLAISCVFWMLLALNETVEREISVPVRLANVPSNVIVTTDLPDTIRITVRDKGYSVCSYSFNGRIRPITFQFGSYAKSSGGGVITTAEITKAVRPMLYGSTKITQVRPDKMEFYFNYGQRKRVPIRLSGHIIPGQNYYLARTIFQPDSVEVFASAGTLDSIKYAYTERQDIRNVTDTIRRTIALRKVKGVKYVPDKIQMAVYPDILTEETVEVPVVAVNMPEGKVLRTFPSRVRVRFVVGVSMFRSIDTSKFLVVADYNEMIATPSDKCTLYLRSVPYGVRKAKLESQRVDYLIEQQYGNENSDNRRNR